MPDRAIPARHSAMTLLLHWGAALILLGAFALGLVMDDFARGAPRDFARMVHYSLGTLVLAVVTLRLLRRLIFPLPATGESGPAAWAARAMHVALYLMMIALPMTGVLDRWARGRRLAIFGDIVIPPPFAIPGGKLWEEMHEVLAWGLVALVAVHVAAALWHHLVLRDGVLRRMLPLTRLSGAGA